MSHDPPLLSSLPHPTTLSATYDRRFACAPFFIPPTTITSTPCTAPLRLRGGGGGGKARRNKSQPSNGSRRLEVPSTSRVKTRSSRASPLTDLDKLKIEEQAVRTEVTRLSLSLRDVDGDGNCLFRALSDQLNGDQKSHRELRKLTCDYLEAHERDLGYWAMLSSFHEGENYARYVERLRMSGQYAGEVEVHAVARMLKRNIRIIHADHSDTIPWEYDPASVPEPTPEPDSQPESRAREQANETPSPSRPRPRTRSSTINLLSPVGQPPTSPLWKTAAEKYLPTIREGRSMIWLALFNDAEHYQSVRRKGDREKGPAEVEDHLVEPHGNDRSERARIARGEIPAPSADTPQEMSSKISMVLASLPAGHAYTSVYIAGILARVKGEVGEAVGILIEEMDTLSEMSDDTNSDGKVERMLIESADESPSADYIPTLPSQSTEYREAPPLIAHPSRPNSPSVSSVTSAGHTSESDDLSRSSVATTPSSSSIKSGRSKRSTSAGSKKGVKPYDRPVRMALRRRGKELSKELEELKMESGSEKTEGGRTTGKRRTQPGGLKAREEEKLRA